MENHPLEELAWNHPTDCWRSRGGEITSNLATLSKRVEGGNRQTPLEAVWNAFPALNQAEVRAALARCGLTTKHYREPNPGAIRWRASQGTLLSLDEP